MARVIHSTRRAEFLSTPRELAHAARSPSARPLGGEPDLNPDASPPHPRDTALANAPGPSRNLLAVRSRRSSARWCSSCATRPHSARILMISCIRGGAADDLADLLRHRGSRAQKKFPPRGGPRTRLKCQRCAGAPALCHPRAGNAIRRCGVTRRASPGRPSSCSRRPRCAPRFVGYSPPALGAQPSGPQCRGCSGSLACAPGGYIQRPSSRRKLSACARVNTAGARSGTRRSPGRSANGSSTPHSRNCSSMTSTFTCPEGTPPRGVFAASPS